jgi:glycosyltransferase involved in cell wall biosynthesis
MRVLFYQPAHEGHHFAYLSRMLPGFVDLPIEILVATTPRAAASTEFEKSLAPFGERIKLVACCTPSPRKPLANARHRLRELQEAIRLTQPDHVAVCYADGIWDVAYVAAALGNRPWSDELPVEGWIYRGRFADADDTRLKSRLRRRMFTGLLRKGLFCKLHLHHELLYEFASEASRGQPTSVCLAPDPIVIRDPLTPAEARRELGIAGGTTAPEKWIGVAGVIARFKGAHLLLDAYRQLRQSAKQPVKLLLAGPSDEHVRTLLSESPYREAVAAGDIVCLDRFLTENEMFAAAAAVDLVVAPYPHHQNRSSIILWAAAAGRPCLSTEDSCVGYVIHKERLGATCNVRDTAAMASAINTLLAKPWTAEDAARVRSYAAFHRMENYQAISSKFVRERLATSGALAAPTGDSVKATA